MNKLLLFSILFLIKSTCLLAQNTHTISGFIKNATDGETLIGVNVYNQANPSQGTVSNEYGFYSLTLPAKTYTIAFSYIGFEGIEMEVNLTSNQQVNVELNDGVVIGEIVVTGDAEDRNISSYEIGVLKLPTDKIKELPALLGEVDVLKTLQLLPGVASSTDGNSGFYVRGGGADQNLVLLDEAVVYNSGHILGFFSVFNADAIKGVTIFKGGMPANYGGRLSSVVDIQMKEGNKKDYTMEGGIGLVSSRLTFQGPLQKDKSSFIVSARRTYIYDIAKPFLRGSDFEGTNYYFYDLNVKMNYEISSKDKLFISGYFGRDVLNFASKFRDANFGVDYGNLTGTIRWNHQVSPKLFMNTSLIYNSYDYMFGGKEFGIKADISSGVEDWNLKIDVDYSTTPTRIPFLLEVPHEIKFGLNVVRYKLTPNFTQIVPTDNSGSLIDRTEPRFSNEYAVYALDRFRVNEALGFDIGLRVSGYTFFGPYTSKITNISYKRNQIIENYFALEPRWIGQYKIDNQNAIKASFSFTNQYIHMVTNTASSLPLDIWVPSTDFVKPQRGWQASAGYFRNFEDNKYELSIETYFRKFSQQIDYAEDYVNDPTDDLEDQFVFGDGKAYGIEFFFRKSKGDWNGWISYTLAKTERLFADINQGLAYPASHDRPHDVSVVLNYDLNPRWKVSSIFVYSSGTTFTPIRSIYLVEQNINYLFGDRNSARVEPYHRLDVSATLTPEQLSDKPFTYSWTFSIYNLYDRRNPLFSYYSPEQDENTGKVHVVARRVSFFPVIPSVTWNFKWKQRKQEDEKPDLEITN